MIGPYFNKHIIGQTSPMNEHRGSEPIPPSSDVLHNSCVMNTKQLLPFVCVSLALGLGVGFGIALGMNYYFNSKAISFQVADAIIKTSWEEAGDFVVRRRDLFLESIKNYTSYFSCIFS